MSGGSMNYVCYRVEEEAECMGDRELIELVKDVAKLMHDREWYLSSDYGEDTWKESARMFKEKWFKSSREERLKSLVEEIIASARKECMELIGMEVKE